MKYRVVEIGEEFEKVLKKRIGLAVKEVRLSLYEYTTDWANLIRFRVIKRWMKMIKKYECARKKIFFSVESRIKLEKDTKLMKVGYKSWKIFELV